MGESTQLGEAKLMRSNLGRLEQVNLRVIWSTEDGDFTPWFAEEDNLRSLGNPIGINLGLGAKEKSVGPFNADILCKDTVDSTWVIIENQPERTDHTHLILRQVLYLAPKEVSKHTVDLTIS